MTTFRGILTTLTHTPPLSQPVLKVVQMIVKRWREICLESPTLFAEVTFAWIIIGWGISLLMVGPPGDPMLRQAMEEMAPVWLWVVLLFAVGLLKLVAAMLDHTRLRQIACLCAMWFWGFWTFTYWRIPYIMPGRFGAPVMGIATILIFWQLAKAVHHGESRDTGRGEISSDIDGGGCACWLPPGDLDEASRPCEYKPEQSGRESDGSREVSHRAAKD